MVIIGRAMDRKLLLGELKVPQRKSGKKVNMHSSEVLTSENLDHVASRFKQRIYE
jgi:hypothetical protein